MCKNGLCLTIRGESMLKITTWPTWDDCRSGKNLWPTNCSDSPSSCFDSNPGRPCWESVSDWYWVRVSSLWGIRSELPAEPGWLVQALRLSDPYNIPAAGTGLADLTLMWMSYSCGDSWSIICLHLYNAWVILRSFCGLVKGDACPNQQIFLAFFFIVWITNCEK